MLGLAVRQLTVSHICSLFRVRLCWGGGGGSVANEGLGLYIRGDYFYALNVMLLVQYVSRRVVMGTRGLIM